MFHCFELQKIKLPKRQAGKIIALVPLDGDKIISLDENNVISQYKVPSGAIQGQMILSFKPRRLVAIGNGSVVALAAEDRSVYEVQVQRGRVTLVVHFQASHHYNTQQVQMRERECFSTMALGSFNAVSACYLRSQRIEERRMKLHFLNKNQGKWITTSHEYPLNGFMAEKLDQYSKMAIWKQQIVTAGEFDFASINLENKVQEEVHLASASFNLFTVVRAVKTFRDGLMVCLNHKNPQILFFKPKYSNQPSLGSPYVTLLSHYVHGIAGEILGKSGAASERWSVDGQILIYLLGTGSISARRLHGGIRQGEEGFRTNFIQGYPSPQKIEIILAFNGTKQLTCQKFPFQQLHEGGAFTTSVILSRYLKRPMAERLGFGIGMWVFEVGVISMMIMVVMGDLIVV